MSGDVPRVANNNANDNSDYDNSDNKSNNVSINISKCVECGMARRRVFLLWQATCQKPQGTGMDSTGVKPLESITQQMHVFAR